MVKFSIISTVGNREDLLPYLLYSVQQQTYQDWELILTTDGPQWRAFSAFQDFRQRFPRPDRLQQHTFRKKPGAWGNHCRREGMRYASGDYVVWCGHDCLMDKDYLEAHVENISSHAGPCISVVHQRYYTDGAWATGTAFPNGGAMPLYVRNLPDSKPPAEWEMGNIDLLNFAVPLAEAKRHAWKVEHDHEYAGDWYTFAALRDVLPVIVSPRVVCGHF